MYSIVRLKANVQQQWSLFWRLGANLTRKLNRVIGDDDNRQTDKRAANWAAAVVCKASVGQTYTSQRKMFIQHMYSSSYCQIVTSHDNDNGGKLMACNGDGRKEISERKGDFRDTEVNLTIEQV